ncbi:hypothetical protein [Parasulfitobacter algicola]|uniref:Exopolysaccharide production repressor exox n=1 Tax=Parasulfitobacter algicola TaxID=2614809 RepID=A0ABX2IPV2_9RHOB|nr:hypothetical protein [Sulfitobacter algicola]NSX54897.1 hypothetical protein [Sulfitobacter algicola]
MRIYAFIALLLIAVGAVFIWSASNDATWGVIALRVLVTLVALQFGYLLMIVLWSFWGKDVSAPPQQSTPIMPSQTTKTENR